MKRGKSLILLSLSLSVLAACGAMESSQEAAGLRISHEERVLGPTHYQASLAQVVLGAEAVSKRERSAFIREGIAAEKVRLAEVARLAEEARVAEIARVAAEAAEAERVRIAAEEEEAAREARRKAAAAAAAKSNQSSGSRTTPTTVAASRSSGSSPAAGSTGTGACGGHLPPCSVMQKESGGNPQAVSPPGYCDGGDTRCHGKWQFDLDTWESLGYSGLPENHSEAVQDEAAAKLLARSGCGQWSTC